MTVFILERATPGLRGKLKRWMLEPHAGVFIGTLSKRVRDKLWQRITGSNRVGGCLMIFRAPTEQGFTIESYGETRRSIIDNEGLQLIRTPLPPSAKKR